jgi:hypothetical protein
MGLLSLERTREASRREGCEGSLCRRTYVPSYCCSSWRSSSGAALTIVPSNSPVFVNSAGALEALRNTGAMVAVIVRLPDAPVKRPVPALTS